jgi:hypothetical protein
MLPRILNQRDSRLDTADADARAVQQPTQTKAFKSSNAQFRHIVQQRVELRMAPDAAPRNSHLKLRKCLEGYMKSRCDSLRLNLHAIFGRLRNCLSVDKTRLWQRLQRERARSIDLENLIYNHVSRVPLAFQKRDRLFE